MQHNMHKRIIALFALLTTISSTLFAQTESKTDTIYNPAIHYSATPRKYEIADITVSGVENYEDYILIGFSGLVKGQEIEIPGNDITTAVKRFWKQGLFSDVSISVTKTYNNLAWINIALKQRPRISQINYSGVKKSEQEDLQKTLGLVVGNQITPNVIDRSEMLVKAHFESKGFSDAEVNIVQRDDISHENSVIVDINVNKNEKTKVNKIYIEGNTVLTDNKLQWTMKKTNERKKLVNLFRSKKFIQEEFENDLNLILEKYNELGYRDAIIIKDSVAKFDDKSVDVFITVDEGKQYHIKKLSWVGNTLYPAEYLSSVLNIKEGDVYDQTKLNKRMFDDDDAVANLYMDKGYLFFMLDPIETQIEGDSIELELRMNEGQQATVNKVIISGNDRLYEQVIRRELRTKPGDLFSKSDLMRSAREIAQTGHFNPENLDIRPEPDPENGTVDLVYGLESKANDQVELSFGWGQTGIVGKVSLKFTNFSMNNLFNPGTYRGIIPQGDGETLTISAETNAQYYQTYSISFFDSWFGNKRPNSFSLSAYYSKQTDMSTQYYNSNYFNNGYYNSYGYGSYGNYGYSDYGSYDYTYALDPDKSIETIGVNAGFGKRLDWPDDYFTFMAELGYQRYKMKDWQYLYILPNGTANSVTLGFTLSRNSTDNPIYTRRGSQFSLSVKATPPYSLWDGLDYETLSKSTEEADLQKMNNWIEYHKWKFSSKTFTPITTIGESHTLVLMTRADFGILGSYNKYKKSPFETFYVGGDGMTGYSSYYATETIGLRGYENGALTPNGYDGYAYTRMGLELRMPLMLESTSTIYALAFVEGGNAWTDIKDFNPFELKRSAGVGARIFLPMLGMMGVDWAYGFDKVFGQVGGSQIHFIIGQEF